MAHSLESQCITDEHFRAFGRIIQAFVTVEFLYEHLLERILNIENSASALVFSAYGYESLKNLLKAVVSEGNLSETEQKECFKLIDKVHDKSTLRNNIAHCTWRPGHRTASIKPMVLKTKGSVFMLGVEHNEKDWSAAELHVEADQIFERGLRIVEFFTARGVEIGTDNGAH